MNIDRLMPYLVPFAALALLAAVAFLPPPYNYAGLLALMLALLIFAVRMERKTGQRAPLVKVGAVLLALWNAYRLLTFLLPA